MSNVVTFQFLRELQKKEKENAELQPIDVNFYKTIAEYVGRKSRMSEQKSSFGNEDEFEKVLPIVRDIFNRRETKIINGALMSARSGAEVKNMLVEEKILFHHIKNGVSENRKRLDDILKGTVLDVKLEGQPEQPVQENNPSALDAISTNGQAPTSQEPSIPKAQMVRIKAIVDIPAFVGEDLETYGPWASGTEIDCPKMASDVFVITGKAERI